MTNNIKYQIKTIRCSFTGTIEYVVLKEGKKVITYRSQKAAEIYITTQKRQDIPAEKPETGPKVSEPKGPDEVPAEKPKTNSKDDDQETGSKKTNKGKKNQSKKV